MQMDEWGKSKNEILGKKEYNQPVGADGKRNGVSRKRCTGLNE